MGNKHIDMATKVQAFMLVTYCNVSQRQAEKLTGVSAKTIRRYCEKAQAEGLNIDHNPILYDRYFEEGKSTGRSPTCINELDERIAAYVGDSKSSREANLDILAHEFSLGRGTVARAMKRNKMRKVKPTKKPGLTEKMMAAKLKFCLDHADWDLERWKDVIWTDETSVVLGDRRGGYRIWRTPKETYEPTCVRPRFKKASDFMFWGCFSYDRKGPYHIYKTETAQDKRLAQAEIDR